MTNLTPSKVVSWCIEQYGMDAEDILIFTELLDIASETDTPEIPDHVEQVDGLLFEVMDKALYYVILDYLDVRADGSIPETTEHAGKLVRWGCRQLLRNSEYRGYDEEYYSKLRHLVKGTDAVDDIILDWLDATIPALDENLKPNPAAEAIHKEKSRRQGILVQDLLPKPDIEALSEAARRLESDAILRLLGN